LQIIVRPTEVDRYSITPIMPVEDRMAAAKRELGRTGLQVTTLGYGAMELRGAPRGRDISEEQAETILNKVLDSGDRLWAERGADWPVYLASAC
jgi:hypothetical protein